MAIDYSKTTLFEGTPEISELKTENKNLIGLNTLLILSLIIVCTIVAMKSITVKEETVNGANDK